MELDELKEKWNILSEEIANQKIVTQEIIDKSLKKKVRTVVTDGQYALGLMFVLMVGLLLFFFFNDFPYRVFAIIIIVICLLYGIWGFYEMSRLNKIISPMLNICEMENYLIKNKRQTKNAYIFSFLIILPSFFVWGVLVERSNGMPLLYSILKIAIFVAIIISSSRYDRKKMKKIEESFKEYKEFMEELRGS